MNENKYTAEDVSDEIESLIKSKSSVDIKTWKPTTYKEGIAIAWNHSPDRLTWRWEGNEIYVGKYFVSYYVFYDNKFKVGDLVLNIGIETAKTESEARLACEAIADYFIKQLTAK